MENRKLLNILTTIFLLTIAYCLSLDIFNDPRMIDGNLSGDEAKLWEIILITVGVLSCFAVVFSAIAHAMANERPGWALAILLVWPLGFYYSYSKTQE